MTAKAKDHAALMDATYRYQRHVYDLTRAWYLLGRDQLIADLDAADGTKVLEIACGTGRNLARIADRYPGARLHGLDISDQMLRSAEATLRGRAALVCADACAFDAQALFGRSKFDRIVLSYAVSMIPDWTRAIEHAVLHLAPGGVLHIVDFHDQARLPVWFSHGLRTWLAQFNVTPRVGLRAQMAAIARRHGCVAHHRSLYRGYAQIGTIHAPGQGFLSRCANKVAA